MSVEGIPMAMQWQIKRLKALQRETVTMTPNKTTDVKPGQTIIVDLPYNSKVDLSTFTWLFDGSTTHNGSSTVDGPAQDHQCLVTILSQKFSFCYSKIHSKN